MGLFDFLKRKKEVKTQNTETSSVINNSVNIPKQQSQSIQREELVNAARVVFNNSFSRMIYDPDDRLWKEPVQKELDLLVMGGLESVGILEELLLQCASGNGGSISGRWWDGSIWAVKAAAMLPQKEAVILMLGLLNRDSRIAEWFTSVQVEAARQLGKIGNAETIPALNKLFENPLPMSPKSEIVEAIKKLGGNIAFSAELCIAEAQNKMPNERIEYYFQVKDKIDSSWTKQQKAYFYYLIGLSAEAGFADSEYKESNLRYAFFAAQIFIRPEDTSMGWKRFLSHGFISTKENAIRLHEAYPLPQNLEEARNYKVPIFNANS